MEKKKLVKRDYFNALAKMIADTGFSTENITNEEFAKFVANELNLLAKKNVSKDGEKKLTDKQTAEASAAEVADEFPEVYTKVVEQLSRLLCEDIKIKRSADGSGKIIVGFASDQEVAALADRLEQIVK